MSGLLTLSGTQRQEQPAVAWAERRTSKRYSSSGQRTLTILERTEFKRHTALVHDLSLRGLGVIVDSPLEVGSIVAILLVNRPTRASGILSGTVCHATPHAEGKWRVGLNLSRNLTDDEILFLI